MPRMRSSLCFVTQPQPLRSLSAGMCTQRRLQLLDEKRRFSTARTDAAVFHGDRRDLYTTPLLRTTKLRLGTHAWLALAYRDVDARGPRSLAPKDVHCQCSAIRR